ncbi:hypothetical protein [Streptomyces sp. NBC_01803]|uniref:hypothetical protein n=1 Tax=Streptomyces sp. NBC_01803 TaxID=2975946 RepID=UPI003FA36074
MNLSVVGILSVLVFVLCRYAGLRISHAAVCVVLGFYLASSSMAGPISEAMSGLFDVIQGQG